MDFKESRELLKLNLEEYVNTITNKSRGKHQYICPCCGSGSGRNGSGAFTLYADTNTWHCFSCSRSGDIFDLVGFIENTDDFKEQYKIVAEMYGNGLENIDYIEEINKYHKQRQLEEEKRQKELEETDYTEFYLEANKNVLNTDYWAKRGLSIETVNKYKLGYAQNWTHPKAQNAPTTPRLIIPTSKHSYLARDVREHIDPEQQPYSKSKVGTIEIFNKKALYNANKPIFVTEGELDALSIIEVGGEAIGIGSISMRKKLIKMVMEKPPIQPLIIAMDNDEAGAKASMELEKELKAANVEYKVVNPYGQYKDANEALQADREQFKKEVYKASLPKENEEEAKKRAYLSKSTENYINEFIKGVSKNANTPSMPTYFNGLDKALDGGLYEGLYIVGAISSLGKTTIITQIADQAAEHGQDVLIFSLEMARTEIMAKSISRLTAQIAINEGKGTFQAKTARGITDGKRYEKYRAEEVEIINAAVERYYKIAKHIYIDEGVGDIGVKQIRETVENHIKYTGNKPIVIIDYLQIMAPYSDRMTDKQNTDKAVMELKRISRDFKVPVIGISSFNRSNYKEAVTMEAFKESGAIEYSSDVLIGLQLKGAGSKDFDPTEAKKKDPREVELVILKNRNGKVGEKINFKFYPMFNYFVEVDSEE